MIFNTRLIEEYIMQYKIFYSFALLLTLTGCSIFPSSTPTVKINVRSAQYLNPDINGRPSPVVVTIYQLKKPFAFKQANYIALANNSGQILGNALIDKHIVEIRPSSYKVINQPLSANTRYLGIVAAYRKINQTKWHAIVKITTRHTTVNVNLESQGLVLQKNN